MVALYMRFDALPRADRTPTNLKHLAAAVCHYAAEHERARRGSAAAQV